MKISELQKLLRKTKRKFGDLDIYNYVADPDVDLYPEMIIEEYEGFLITNKDIYEDGRTAKCTKE